MKVEEEKNNPPLWFLVAGIIFISITAYFVMMAPTKPYTPDNQYYLKDAQSKIIYKTNFVQANIS
jgi:hypothetical protein